MADMVRATEGVPGERRAEAHGIGQYVAVVAVLVVITVVELGVSRTAAIPKHAAIVALVLLAIAKAALIALFFMHLRFETRILRATVLVPLLAPAGYGIVLMADALWRHMR
jgi:cytochrome c oxidase subunit IV